VRRKPSIRRRRSRKTRKRNAYDKDFLRLSRLEAVRDRGDHRRWRWLTLPESIATDADTFEPMRSDDWADYEGHFEFHPEEGRVWVIDAEHKKGGQQTAPSPSSGP
jgi:hypothetical protein